ncbi:MAG: Tetratricopeptide repeat [Cyanobacteria bacterium RYN_339]|nr:Tetratricopeptide repeat [Cyanobacteria bacterium RYN_339]
MPGKRCAFAALPLLLLLAAPAWGYGQLDLTAHPRSARVWVDGAPAGGVPTTIDLTAGSHAVKVAAPGWAAQHFAVKVQNGRAVTRTLRLLPYARTKLTPRLRLTPAHAPVRVSHRPAPRRVVHAKPHGYAARVRQASAAAPPVVEALPMPLPAPAFAMPVPVPVSATDGLLPPPAPTPAVPAPPVPAPASVPGPASVGMLGLDARSWADLGWLTLLGSLVGGLVGLVAQRLQGPSEWHGRRPRRDVITPTDEADNAPADAWAALRAEDWATAARLLWACQPASPWVYYHLGLAYEHMGHDLEAEAAYRTAVAADPGYAAAGYNLGTLLDRQGLGPQAAIAYRRLLEACPTDADALFNLGHLNRELGLPQKAEVHWAAARQLAPRDLAVAENLKLLRRERRIRPNLLCRSSTAPRHA